ncbi:MAG: AIR synthase-related protein, partial [Ktedonobacteraceae bacterium]
FLVGLPVAQLRLNVEVAQSLDVGYHALAGPHSNNRGHGVIEASVTGTFSGDHRLTVLYHDEVVADLSMEFLHAGRPERILEAVWTEQFIGAHARGALVAQAGRTQGAPLHAPTGRTQGAPLHENYADILLALLGHPTIASKETVVRRYDHEVQGATVLKPLVGRAGNGPGDAAVLQPILDPATNEQTGAGIVLANGINPLYSAIDPYHMALNAVDEALRNLTAVGGDIERAAILDNFCWGSPTDPAQLGMLVRAVKGCHDAAVGFGTPFISGKDSLNNEYRVAGQRLPVIPTLLISAVGVIDDATRTVDMSLKAAGNRLYLIGATRNELAGSHYAEIGCTLPIDTAVPQVDVSSARVTMKALGEAIRSGLTLACHDLSEGGMAVAAAEMALAGLLGLHLDLDSIPVAHGPATVPVEIDAILLFSESPSRFLVEVAPEQRAAFEAHMQRAPIVYAEVGSVTDTGRFVIVRNEETLIDLPVEALQAAWKGEQP